MTTKGNNLTLITTHVQREKDINKCILCQKEKRSEKTSSTENGRQKIKDASMKMNDSLLINLNDSEQNQIRYHSRECYKTYILKAERFRVVTTNHTPTNDTTIEDDEALLFYNFMYCSVLRAPGAFFLIFTVCLRARGTF